MQIFIGAIGRLKKSDELNLCNKFETRIKNAGAQLGFTQFNHLDFDEDRHQQVQTRKNNEAEKLLKSVPKGAIIVALDEFGKQFTSVDFSQKIATYRDDGHSCIAFLLGGPDGHGQQVLNQADLKLSLSKMTWPHQIARALLFEQIYRAITIMSNHPYHRE
ncbi:MAG: 23S rRNA (pseudouridine(1915)-N(3))-methyltransferase RlmH [Rhizobiales bacterium]|nr:23S rRNA (pseudouridine(1915)-N(3))-methyltransferase RlmH [Hyphomicrobiales bacterium]NRB14676.1 23S rRNA (pseudouridine(1915)-N(3))-methyltransferase RlmH [Hyphomicrobiales bacterium]